MDNHSSHFNFGMFLEALKNEIHIVALPPHASHIYQPLDVGVFRGMRNTFREILRKYLRTNRLQKVTKETFPAVLKQLWQELRPKWLEGGFRGAGLCPFDRNRIDKRKFLPSVGVTKVPTIRRCDRLQQVSSIAHAADAPSISFEAASVSGLPMIIVHQEKPMSPRTAMRSSIERCVLGPQRAAPEAVPKKRTKVQNFCGQVVTEKMAMEALAERERSRRKKKLSRRSKKRSAAEAVQLDDDSDAFLETF